ncbi:MAG TPA: type II toxin-antitoxin system HicB family antitoxin [Pyrinomonadaceae bacterium]
METKYTIHIFWSDPDEGFIAVCDEFPGLSAFGSTREDALEEAQAALDIMIEHYLATGQKLPEPKPILVAA